MGAKLVGANSPWGETGINPEHTCTPVNKLNVCTEI